jgi:hypothetical protein
MRLIISSNARKSPDQNIVKAATIIVKRLVSSTTPLSTTLLTMPRGGAKALP